MARIDGWRSMLGPIAMLSAVMMALVSAVPARGQIDRTRYMSPDELRPGLKGFGRTVISGTEVETFDLEVISVMRNAHFAKQDVILIRCSGLNLEHSGIVGGMSGSPCYIRDETGTERMFGAVAFGWTFNKDPICGVQPITQMVDIPEVRRPDKPSSARGKETAAQARRAGRTAGTGIPIGKLLARAWPEPIDPRSRFRVLDGQAEPQRPRRRNASAGAGQLRPLMTPVMVSGASGRGMGFLQERLERFGLMPVAAGGASENTQAQAKAVDLEPGSVLCVPLMTGDVIMEALGTCTEVVGGKVLGFGHALFGEGAVELPLATGFIHTVIPSVIRSNKLGGSLRTVGTLWGDESSGIFGTIGKGPKMIPLDVVVTDIRGERSYHYELVQEEYLTGLLMGVGAMESVFAHSELPKEHTIRYGIEVDFEGLGTYRTRNFTSQSGVYGVSTDLMYPVRTLMRAPFEKQAKATRARLEVSIEKGAQAAQIAEVTMAQSTFKPGETVTVRVRWFHYRKEPMLTYASYALTLPDDIPDGEYELTVGSTRTQLTALQSEKPHLFRVENLSEALEALNLVASFPENRLYMRVGVGAGGLAFKKVQMPELPSFRRKILVDSKNMNMKAYSDALVVQHETEFAVSGEQSLSIQVSRRADQ